MLEIDMKAFVATIIIFLGLIAFLNAILYKPILLFMDKREASIKKDEEMALQNFSGVNETNMEIESVLSKARDEANSIKSAAIEQQKQKINLEIESKKAELEVELQQYLKDLEIQRNELKLRLSKDIPEFKQHIKSGLARL